MANPNYRAPKRRIEKVVSRISHQITNSAATTILHTCEDRKTLIRTLIQLKFINVSGSPKYGIVYAIEPRGQSVTSPSYTEVLDADQVPQQLWERSSQFVTGTDPQSEEIQVDLHQMRKLNPGDELVIRDTADVATSVNVQGIITQWFKE